MTTASPAGFPGNPLKETLEPTVLPPRPAALARWIWVLPAVAALALPLAVWYKLTRPPQVFLEIPDAGAVRQAPLFQLHDQSSQLVRLSRYTGRHKLLIVFFDGRPGVDRSALLEAVRANYSALYDARALVLAISGELPSKHREGIERGGGYPFLLLSDIRDFEVHRRWGAYSAKSDRPLEGVFVVDRSGWIRHARLGPDHLGTPADWIKDLNSVR